jgi:3-oxoacyl-[acyl-carrier protein] reductase
MENRRMLEKNFTGKCAIVTGAGEGIGFEIARQLAHQGTQVLLNDIDTDKASHAAESINAETSQTLCLAQAGDVGEVEVVQGLVVQAVHQFGRLDIAVANAGITLWNRFLDYTPEAFFRVLKVNLGGTFFLAQAAARQMRQQGTEGRLLFMSSVTAHQAIEYLSAYAMTKAAIEMLAKQLTAELAPYGITVNSIAPGATVTPRNLADDPNYEQVWGNLIPTGRSAWPADIAQAALFLLSPAASQITGQTLVVDGGWSAISRVPTLDFVEKSHPDTSGA